MTEYLILSINCTLSAGLNADFVSFFLLYVIFNLLSYCGRCSYANAHLLLDNFWINPLYCKPVCLAFCNTSHTIHTSKGSLINSRHELGPVSRQPSKIFQSFWSQLINTLAHNPPHKTVYFYFKNRRIKSLAIS